VHSGPFSTSLLKKVGKSQKKLKSLGNKNLMLKKVKIVEELQTLNILFQYGTHHSYELVVHTLVVHTLVVHTLRVAENEILKLDLPAKCH
jgi:hypothetical protein